jgi:hypothetical protein
MGLLKSTLAKALSCSYASLILHGGRQPEESACTIVHGAIAARCMLGGVSKVVRSGAAFAGDVGGSYGGKAQVRTSDFPSADAQPLH